MILSETFTVLDIHGHKHEAVIEWIPALVKELSEAPIWADEDHPPAALRRTLTGVELVVSMLSPANSHGFPIKPTRVHLKRELARGRFRVASYRIDGKRADRASI